MGQSNRSVGCRIGRQSDSKRGLTAERWSADQSANQRHQQRHDVELHLLMKRSTEKCRRSEGTNKRRHTNPGTLALKPLSVDPLAAIPAKTNGCQGSGGRQNKSRSFL